IRIAAVSLIEGAAQSGGGGIQVAAPRQRYAEMMPGFRKLAVALFDGVIEGFDGFGQFAALEQRHAKIMISPRVIAAALLDGFAVSVNRFAVLAAPRQGDAETVISIGIIGLLFDRSAEGGDCSIDIAEVEQGAGQLIMRSREVAVAHLYRHA